MKKVLISLLVMLVVLLPVLGVDAASKKKTTTTTTTVAGKKVNFYIFYGSSCGYCAALHSYVAELVDDPTINYMFNVVDYEVWGDEDNNNLMMEVAEEMNHDVQGVPVYVIGEEIYGGYSEAYNQTIRDAIEKAYKNTDTKDVVARVAKEIESGDRHASENEKNKTIGYVMLGITAIIVIAILFSRNNTTYYDDDDDEDDDDDDDVESEDEDDDDDEFDDEDDDDEEEVKKTTTKNTTTKKKTNTKKKR